MHFSSSYPKAAQVNLDSEIFLQLPKSSSNELSFKHFSSVNSNQLPLSQLRTVPPVNSEIAPLTLALEANSLKLAHSYTQLLASLQPTRNDQSFRSKTSHFYRPLTFLPPVGTYHSLVHKGNQVRVSSSH